MVMAAESMTIRTTRASRLAEFVRSRENEIVEDWYETARTLPSARGMERSEIVDHVPPLLRRIADIADGIVRGEHVADPKDLAEKHARDRLAAGFEVGEL